MVEGTPGDQEAGRCDAPLEATVRGLIVPVGISADPVIFSLERIQPEYLGLLGTADSEETLATVFERVSFPPHRVRYHTVRDSPENLNALVNHVYDLFRWMRFEKNIPAEAIAIDPTPGRKWMSAGATMVAAQLGLQMFYVDMTSRDGRPDPSSMRLVRMGNAYDLTAHFVAERARVLFNQLNFASAWKAYDDIRPTRSQELDFCQGMALLARTLHRWDLFEHYETSLRDDFSDAVARLRRHAASVGESGALEPFLAGIERLADTIEELHGRPLPNPLAIADLVQNARRKIRQGYYDDAVGRLYRAFEAVAQYFLKTDFNLDTSAPNWNAQPEHVRAAVARACLVPPAGPRNEECADATTPCHIDQGALPERIACVQGWQILRELDHPAAAHVFARVKGGKWTLKLEGLLQKRNHSLLAHGWQHVSKRDAELMEGRITELFSVLAPGDFPKWLERFAVPELPGAAGRSETRPRVD